MATYTAVDPAAALAFGPFAAGSTPAPTGASGSQTVTTPGAGSFVWPANIDRVTVQCWGAGSGGNGGPAADRAAGGGGGGYSSKLVLGVPGQSYAYTVGAGGAGGAGGGAGSVGGDGGDTSFNDDEVLARGAQHGDTFSDAGVGGHASNGEGTIKFTGGDGSDAAATTGGGGGSSAGIAANGVTATTVAGATAPSGGGNGGNGGNAAVGAAGSAPGGGGGGGDDTFAGGAGGNGKIVFTW